MTSLLLSIFCVIGGLPFFLVQDARQSFWDPGVIVNSLNEQTDAAACFSKAKPEVDPATPKAFTVACPDAAGNEVVIYHFTQTRAGWKFTGLDNLNE